MSKEEGMHYGSQEYTDLYNDILKSMTDQQVINLLISNAKNQQKLSKKYGQSKRQIAHIEKMSVHLELLNDELLRRLGND